MYAGRRLEGTLSSFVHYFLYKLRMHARKTPLEMAMLSVSVDVDVGNRRVGLVNEGKNDASVHDYLTEYVIGELEEQSLPLIIDFFDALEIPVTFGIRGQLLEVDTSVLEDLSGSSVRHDIGSHSYYHKDFTCLSYDEAESDLRLVSDTMKKFGITPKSFIFPRSKVAHLDLLEKYGYKCFRGYGNFMNDGMYIGKLGELYDIHPGLYIGRSGNAFFIKKIIDIAVSNRLPFHVWFHPWDLGKGKKMIRKNVNKILFPIFKCAKLREKGGLLKCETMLSVAERMESIASAKKL